jgi:hypothetical protein
VANQLSIGLISTCTRIRSWDGVDGKALLPACLNLVRWMAVTTANQKRRENSGLDSSADVTSITSMQAAPTRAGGSMWQARRVQRRLAFVFNVFNSLLFGYNILFLIGRKPWLAACRRAPWVASLLTWVVRHVDSVYPALLGASDVLQRCCERFSATSRTPTPPPLSTKRCRP